MHEAPGWRLAAFIIPVLCFLGASPSAQAADLDFPPLTGRVVDDAGILSPSVEGRLTEELAAHEQRTGEQVVVATLKSLQGRTIEEYGYQLLRAWGIGQKGKNNGAILIVAPNERKVRIEVGYGLEGTLTDAVSSTIINGSIRPRFREGDMQGGVVLGAEQILRALGDDLKAPAVPPPAAEEDDRGGQIGSILLTFLIFGLFVWFAGRRRGGPGILPFLILGSWSSRGGSGFGGGGFGGGGGGFSGGGGSGGGGGASGSW